LRQTRESTHWQVEIWVGEACLVGDVRDVSLGGVGTVLCLDSVWESHLVYGSEVYLCFLWDDQKTDGVSKVFARVTWLGKSGDKWDVGFEFSDLDDATHQYIDRYLLARTVARNLKDDRST